jgi:glucose-1-phosphate thymidylyltransferase
LQENLNHAITVGEFDEIRKGVYASDESVCGQFVTADTSAGPIVLHTASIVEPHAHLRGPLWVGEQAIVRSHASVRGGVAVGSHSRIGGEVQDSVVEPYSNKQHLGFLGHSYLGSWVNWGAGTSNSNLKNTYGSVKMLYGQKQIDTGMTFLGCIVGDHVKSAINTSIFSGKTIGPCSMLYGFVTENVPAFTNFARQFGDITEIALETAIEGERRMMARRNVAMTAERQAMLREIFERTRDQRQDLPCRPPRF